MRDFRDKLDIMHRLAKTAHVTPFEDFLAFLDGKMQTPTLYGWFHLLCLVAVVVLCVLIFLKAKNMKDKTFNLILGITAGVLIFLEIYTRRAPAFGGSFLRFFIRFPN